VHHFSYIFWTSSSQHSPSYHQKSFGISASLSDGCLCSYTTPVLYAMAPIESKTYLLPPTPRIPNSPYPLIHYPGLLLSTIKSPDFSTTHIFDLFRSHGWQSQWIARYGPDIQSHYHSVNETMVVISGQGATIRFGVADALDWESGKLGFGERGQGEQGGVDIQAGLGDVFVIPAGVAHKTFNPKPDTRDLAFHQPEDIAQGNANLHLDEASEMRHRAFFDKVPVEGEFMMMGAYPRGGVWDFAVGGEHEGREREVWGVDVPGEDPVLGGSIEGLRGLWKGIEPLT
jgi:uncharacterized protein YjlB